MGSVFSQALCLVAAGCEARSAKQRLAKAWDENNTRQTPPTAHQPGGPSTPHPGCSPNSWPPVTYLRQKNHTHLSAPVVPRLVLESQVGLGRGGPTQGRQVQGHQVQQLHMGGGGGRGGG